MLTRKAKRGTAGALLLSDAIFVIGVGGYLATQRSLINAGRAAHPQEVLAGIDEIQAGLLSAESSVRRHVLTDKRRLPACSRCDLAPARAHRAAKSADAGHSRATAQRTAAW
ncbi:hypothetical protein XcodCFBP4690_08460 [Xanthomonas codiaei]|uniref:Uncharacterized protein n=1 Tax=Xanthomonas codiaei TaxID=56463 RepID=A0A2S7CSK7_9XANT|nr:hypothetical protein XcodCFBP4690_08460 [Xanthomonas codiaei]